MSEENQRFFEVGDRVIYSPYDETLKAIATVTRLLKNGDFEIKLDYPNDAKTEHAHWSELTISSKKADWDMIWSKDSNVQITDDEADLSLDYEITEAHSAILRDFFKQTAIPQLCKIANIPPKMVGY